jgi:hypothetical protein
MANYLFRVGRSFTVSAYVRQSEPGRIFYTQPVNPDSCPAKSVRYRIRVTPKPYRRHSHDPRT